MYHRSMTNTTGCDYCSNPAPYNLSTPSGARAHVCTIHVHTVRKGA